MKKFDWFTILGAIAVTENTVLMIAQGGWFTVAGLIFGGIWIWVAYWDWKNRRLVQTLDYLSRNRAEVESADSCLRSLAEAGISTAEAIEACSRHSEPRGCVGDASCRWNARSPYIRCAINPSGECQGCKHYERI
ncbi:hypothetical protein FD723_18605 [Nostoc sp. C052]|uniref:DUF6464 family protein n=1 Tax=Nostoc sp. C052 TaxID=2576902 RepID=UPI0015C3ABAF|nr:DUF6464 family protein [Nostoc sp. C052]QLE42232.1 hypothetical protein FD723_18605 [Nostoc sp. C052]